MASGDVVNTAARLQSAAPVNGVIVDETTYRATRHAIDYREAEPVEAKGKAEPIAIWEAVEARARFGTEVLDHVAGELVGREREVDALSGGARSRARRALTSARDARRACPASARAACCTSSRAASTPSRSSRPGVRARCLAYGDGITFWALAEIVKAQAGILEADDDATAAEKLRRAAEEIVDPADADWVAARLRPLAGLEDESELGGGRGTEAFAAWRRFFEELAAQRPLILVFEDLQWADEGLLDFVDELVDWVTDVPMLVVCTARPELLARRPNWGGGKLNASTIALEPLSDVETARLMADVARSLGAPGRRPADPARARGREPALRRAVRPAVPRARLGGGAAAPRDVAGHHQRPSRRPARRGEGVPPRRGRRGQGLLDGRARRTTPSTRSRSSTRSVRKGFLRRQRRSSVAGEVELAFAHALVRDVAYGQMPRAERAARHRAVAEWLESLGRNEDHAEMLAYHWRSALELAGASGDDTHGLEERTRLALVEAGDRAFGLNAFGPAVAYYDEALALWPAEAPGRAELLFRKAHALHVLGDDATGGRARGGTRRAARDRRRETAGQAEAFLSRAAWYRGHGEEAQRHIERAQELVADAGTTLAKARVLCLLARLRMLSQRAGRGDRDRHRGARRWRRRSTSTSFGSMR